METTIVYWGHCWENGKQDGNYYSILGLHRDIVNKNGNYYLGFRV